MGQVLRVHSHEKWPGGLDERTAGPQEDGEGKYGVGRCRSSVTTPRADGRGSGIASAWCRSMEALPCIGSRLQEAVGYYFDEMRVDDHGEQQTFSRASKQQMMPRLCQQNAYPVTARMHILRVIIVVFTFLSRSQISWCKIRARSAARSRIRARSLSSTGNDTYASHSRAAERASFSHCTDGSRVTVDAHSHSIFTEPALECALTSNNLSQNIILKIKILYYLKCLGHSK